MEQDIDILITLLEDPDPEVHKRLSQLILRHGDEAIPKLEIASLDAESNFHYDRINEILDELKFRNIKSRLKTWLEKEKDLVTGFTLLTELLEPDKTPKNILGKIKKLRNEIWLELSNRLTALEKIRILNHFFFIKNNFRIDIPAPSSPIHFSISKLLSDRSGIEESIFAVYSIIARLLGLPVYGIKVPGNILLAYLDIPYTPVPEFDPSKVTPLFFIYPGDKGRIFGVKEINHFLSSLYPDKLSFEIKALSDHEVVRIYAESLAESCRKSGKIELENKVRELLTLWDYQL